MKTCPRCGHVNREEALWCEMCQKGLTFWGRMSEPWGKTGITSKISMTWALLTAAGCLWLFLFPPLGICLLIVSPFIRTVPKKAVPGLCPHCGKDAGIIRQPGAPQEFSCIHCAKLIVIDHNSGRPVFVDSPNQIVAATSSPASDSTLFFASSTQADHLSAMTDWSPLRGGGKSFRSNKLVLTDNDRLEYKMTRKGLTNALPFLAIGLFLVAMALCDKFILPLDGVKSSLGCFLGGIAFSAVGSWLLYSDTIPIVFDRRMHIFCKGRRALFEGDNPQSKNIVVPLDRIRGIQILTETVQCRDSSFQSHELNLVLDNGNRIHLVDQGGLSKVRQDAETISRFLGIPILQMTS